MTVKEFTDELLRLELDVDRNDINVIDDRPGEFDPQVPLDSIETYSMGDREVLYASVGFTYRGMNCFMNVENLEDFKHVKKHVNSLGSHIEGIDIFSWWP